MRKILKILIVTILLIIDITIIVILFQEIKIIDIRTKIELNLGKKVVMENDTLLIKDYSFYDSTYTLSNGKIMSIKLVEKLQFIN